MKKILLIFSVFASVTFFTSCEDTVLDDILTSDSDSTDIAGGLKEALRVGTDTAVSKLNIEDGYFKDAALKILLPDELETTIANFKAKSIDLGLLGTITGETLYTTGFSALSIEPLQAKEEELILGLNRAAENAASEAKPIFVDAITGMSIADANSILFGEDTAATAYLRTNTSDALFTNFEPKIENSLSQVKIGDKAVATLYEDFVADYNSILSTSVPLLGSIGELAGVNTIAQTDISVYTTNKALSGLFNKVAEEESDIRNNPLARVSDLLEDVFGLLD